MLATTVLVTSMLGVGLTPSTATSAERDATTNPTKLRLVEPRAARAISDGERFVVITFPIAMRRSPVVYDTHRGRRSQMPDMCRLAGIAQQTTVVTAGRALIVCDDSSVYRVLDLATGTPVADLPSELEADGVRFGDPEYSVLGKRWIQASVDCPDQVGCAAAYYDYRTGETRLSRYPDGPEFRSARQFYDLDSPDLALRTVCRPSIEYDTLERHYRPPLYFDRDSGLRRCRDGDVVQRVAGGGDVTADLSASAMTWGVAVPDARKPRFAYVHYYDLRRRRQLSWRLPPIDHRPASGTAIATRCDVFALTSRTFGDRGGGVSSIRVHRAHLPAPLDAGCPG